MGIREEKWPKRKDKNTPAQGSTNSVPMGDGALLSNPRRKYLLIFFQNASNLNAKPDIAGKGGFSVQKPNTNGIKKGTERITKKEMKSKAGC